MLSILGTRAAKDLRGYKKSPLLNPISYSLTLLPQIISFLILPFLLVFNRLQENAPYFCRGPSLSLPIGQSGICLKIINKKAPKRRYSLKIYHDPVAPNYKST